MLSAALDVDPYDVAGTFRRQHRRDIVLRANRCAVDLQHDVARTHASLAGGRLVSQGLYDRGVKTLGHEGITDVIVLMGYYTAVSLTMNFYAVPAGTPGLAR